MEFFRHCPGCRRRFHVRIVDKRLTGLAKKTEKDQLPHTTIKKGMGLGMPTVMVQGDRGPGAVEVATFQYTYKCSFCGYEWKEKKIRERQKTDPDQ
jgi:hypothetical protein